MLSTWKLFFLLYLYEQRWVPQSVIFALFVWATMVSTSKRYFWLYLYEQRWSVPQNVIFDCICMSNDGEYLKTLFLTVFVWAIVWATMASTSKRYFWLYLYEQLYEQRWWVPQNVIFDCICMSNDGEYLKTLFLTVFVWVTMVSTSRRYFWLYLYEQRWCYEIILD